MQRPHKCTPQSISYSPAYFFLFDINGYCWPSRHKTPLQCARDTISFSIVQQQQTNLQNQAGLLNGINSDLSSLSSAVNSGWKHGLHYRPAEVKGFNGTIAVCTAIATCLNFLGINPMKALVWSSVVQGLSTPLLMLLNHDDYDQPQDHGMMGEHSSNKSPRWITTAAIFAASIGFLVTWLITASH
jgi:hypothetical protein